MNELARFITENFWTIIVIFVLLIDRKYRPVGLVSSLSLAMSLNHMFIFIAIMVILIITNFRNWMSTPSSDVSDKQQGRKDPDHVLRPEE